MSRIYVPATKPEDWKACLAEKDKQWKTGYSAKTLAYCWQEVDGFPNEIKSVFQKSRYELFRKAELLLAFPEYKVPLKGGNRASQNDIFILARAMEELIAITVEGKVSEPFGETVGEWKKTNSKGRKDRLQYLSDILELPQGKDIDIIRYQLLHRTASALIEARRFNAKYALMLVHSFSQSDEWFDDYKNFLLLYNVHAKINGLLFAKNLNGIELYFSWIKGDSSYLSR